MAGVGTYTHTHAHRGMNIHEKDFDLPTSWDIIEEALCNQKQDTVFLYFFKIPQST